MESESEKSTCHLTDHGGNGRAQSHGGGGHDEVDDAHSEEKRVTEWLQRRPGALYEDLIEEYSRASVSAWAITRIVVGWIAFILDPAAGLLILDGSLS